MSQVLTIEVSGRWLQEYVWDIVMSANSWIHISKSKKQVSAYLVDRHPLFHQIRQGNTVISF